MSKQGTRKCFSYPFLITSTCEVQNYEVSDRSRIEHLSGLKIIVLRRTIISFIMSVLKEQLGSHWPDFQEI